jgi:hypothetical protein
VQRKALYFSFKMASKISLIASLIVKFDEHFSNFYVGGRLAW